MIGKQSKRMKTSKVEILANITATIFIAAVITVFLTILADLSLVSARYGTYDITKLTFVNLKVWGPLMFILWFIILFMSGSGYYDSREHALKKESVDFYKWLRVNYIWDNTWVVSDTDKAYDLFKLEQSKTKKK